MSVTARWPREHAVAQELRPSSRLHQPCRQITRVAHQGSAAPLPAPAPAAPARHEKARDLLHVLEDPGEGLVAVGRLAQGIDHQALLV